MLIYTVHVQIQPQRAVEWVTWMQEVHIPDVMATGFFKSFEFTPRGNEEYRVTYYCESRDLYEQYRTGPAMELQNQHKIKFQGDFEARRELTEEPA